MLFSILFINFYNVLSVKISVIIPIYNSEKYLSECLESIINQTFKDIEIICINDGSKDKSEQIIKQYAKKDKRIILLNQENKGAGPARDKGIKISKGEYLSFIDSDDFFHFRTLEIAYNNIKKFNSDVLRFQYFQFKNKNELKINEKIESYNIKNFSMSMGWCCVVWNRIWKASIIKKNKISFGKLKSGQDNVFNAKIFPFLKNIILLDVKLAYHRKVYKSLSSNYKNKSMYLYKSIPEIINTWKMNNIITKTNSEKIYYSLFNFVSFFNKEYKKIFKKYLISEKIIFNNDFISNSGRFKNELRKLELESSTL
jgi:glycosyltransferase involved in cell wall biosynthesis